MPKLGSGQSQEHENTQVTDTLARELHNSAETDACSVVPEIAAETDSKQSMESNPPKKPKGGRRPGAGRKPDLARRLARQITRETAGELLAFNADDIYKMFRDIFKGGNRALQLQAWTALNDRHFGKPRQDVGVAVSGSVTHIRDPLLSTLPPEALQEAARFRDGLLSKYSTPAIDVAPSVPEITSESSGERS